MALINLHQDSLFAARLPVYMSPALLSTVTPLFSAESDHFDSKFHSEIVNLQERRHILSQKLAQAKDQPQDASLRQEILQEYSALEQAKKWLALLADAIEKSRQSVAANMR